MKISTIIPVYNDGKHVERAVESALKQPEVFEVVLVEDGSTDNSLEICRMLSRKHEKVVLCTHPENKNMKAAISRNLGIEKSKYDFISFLDADDWYLDDRFGETKNVFEQNPDAEGVYDAVGTNFQDEHNKNIWLENRERLLTVPTKIVSPDDFLLKIVTENIGSFHTNGIVLKKSVFEKVGYFDPKMEPSEDMHLWFRLMSVCKLYPGDIENARAMRFCHDGNRFLKDIKKLYRVRKLYWLGLFEWSLSKKLPRKISSLILLPTLLYKSNLYRPTKSDKGFSFKKIIVFIFYIIKNFFKDPIITMMMVYWGLLRFINLLNSNSLFYKLFVIFKKLTYSVLSIFNFFINLTNFYSKGKLPDFLIIGAQKAGTTSLAQHIAKHRFIDMTPMYGVRHLDKKNRQFHLKHFFSNKEIHFFDNDFFWVQGVPWYKGFFRKNNKLNFEATPDYILNFKAQKRMSKVVPNAKLILIIRNPVFRAFSSHNHRHQTNNFFDDLEKEKDFNKLVSNINEQDIKKNKNLFSQGFYIDQIENLLKYFPREQLLILVSEEMKKNPQKIYNQIFEFLNVEKVPIKYSENIHKRKYSQKMTTETIEKLKNFYAPYNERFYNFLGYRIREWEK